MAVNAAVKKKIFVNFVLKIVFLSSLFKFC